MFSALHYVNVLVLEYALLCFVSTIFIYRKKDFSCMQPLTTVSFKKLSIRHSIRGAVMRLPTLTSGKIVGHWKYIRKSG